MATERNVARSFEIYNLISDRHIYVGSAWGRTAAQRWNLHRTGRGAAPALWAAIRAGVMFTLVVVESSTGTLAEARVREQHHLDAAVRLGTHKVLNLNMRPSDPGSNPTSPEVRAKLSAAARRRRGADPAERERRSRVAKELSNRPERLEKMRTDNPVRFLTPEKRAEITAKITGKTRSEESRRRYSEAARRRWADPEHKEKMRAAIKAAWDRRQAINQEEAAGDARSA